MRDSSATADTVDVVLHDAPDAPTTDDGRGLSRRGFVGRTALVGAAGAVLASGTLAAPAGAAGTAAEPGLPSVASVQAKLAAGSRVVDLEIMELAALLQAGELTSVALTQAYLDRIDALNGPFEYYASDSPGYNAFVRIDRPGALAAASAADARLSAARSGGAAAPYLCGIPIGVKDSIALKGRPVQNGTDAFKGNVGLQDATAMGRLRAQGVVFLGHTIASPFSGSTSGSFAGNAWDKRYIPGGSSQGSGVAPVARLAAGAIAEETGGSIMFPSAANGGSGIKPSLGLTSIAGVMPLRPGVDVLGPISRSVRDSALLLNAMIGADANDPSTQAAPMPAQALPVAPSASARPLDGLRIGIPQTDWMSNQVGTSPQDTYDADYLAAFDRLRGQLTELGAEVVEFPGLDMTDATQNQYHLNNDELQPAVAGALINPLNAVTYPNLHELGFAKALEAFAVQFPDRRAALEAQFGNFTTLAARHAGVNTGARVEGQRRRRKLAENYQRSLDDAGVDFMLVMTIGAKIGQKGGGYSVSRSYFQIPNMLGWPMVSFPIGYGTDAEALPISAQFWGTRFMEAQIVQAAIDYQAAHPEYHTAVPADPPAVTPAAKSRRPSAEALRAVETAEDPLFTNDPEAYAAAAPDVLRPR
jgi:Asp-tRNA(Asn)/Glu-tRNA(Gln) amidotransferase A subunit family amidase